MKTQKLLGLVSAGGVSFSLSPGLESDVPKRDAASLIRAGYAVPARKGLTLEAARVQAAANVEKARAGSRARAPKAPKAAPLETAANPAPGADPALETATVAPQAGDADTIDPVA